MTEEQIFNAITTALGFTRTDDKLEKGGLTIEWVLAEDSETEYDVTVNSAVAWSRLPELSLKRTVAFLCYDYSLT